MHRNISLLLLLIIVNYSTNILAQEDDSILPGQKKAIRALAEKQGFNNKTLNEYLQQERGITLIFLSKKDASDIIRLFQSGNAPTPADIRTPESVEVIYEPDSQVIAPKPVKTRIRKEKPKPKIAENLEVGMSKRFHLIDGNIIQGEIIKMEELVCHIETIDGLLYIPSEDILEETATITKKDDTRYIGPVLRETLEEIVLRSKYGDVVISKRDVKEMDRYHGGKRVPWLEEKKTFFRGEVVLTDIFMDPTAFPLTPNTFYLSGLSLGYGFTDRFMVRTKFASDFQGDLNFMPHFRFYHRQTGTSRRAAAVGGHLFNHHPMETVVAKYSKYVYRKDDDDPDNKFYLDKEDTISVNDVMDQDTDFYWELYTVLSSRRSMTNKRGELGWHVGAKTNSLALQKPDLSDGFKWDAFIPFRFWAAFEYDLSKSLKLAGIMWVDNGHKFRDFGQVWNDYIVDTPFILDAKSGEYRMVDFDFGFLYAISETFRIGIHFQEPFFVFYWKFFEL